ncbi:MAG TPA: TIGR01777 family oxidoreductase [Bryobacteraceae bacterium]|nr:TIGR01777 family oxidoreductase [Bryobacteraceae bacterium]HOL73207.1 TIGR01777 family oxidoreductase [Bryobacteraceae bacterium]HOQ43930.1 TIGR01777 family oxidoreductase [Bryobacteraceae bacterium]HPQ15440.1 TIGR01777 family oxidoreductase [Bryobacteraceae bacterium]HPU72908.1 TIGR01777 family oxidoreductase [Bryobacteraceae bacterium]
MRIAVTGASGFIGRALTARLAAAGHTIEPLKTRESFVMPPCDAVVNLAGEPIAQRWTPEAKQRIRYSRVEGTRRLVESMGRLTPPPAVLVCASAVGFYGSRGDEILRETSPPGEDFLAGVCVAWERAAAQAETFGIRVVCLRTGVVLGRDGGALQRMLPVFRFGAGGPLGSGRQWMSWIHLDDLTALYEFALNEPRLRGAVNAVAPHPVTNAEFARALGDALHRPAWIPVPAFALKLMFGEMAGVLLDSQRVVPEAAQAAGFDFRYPELGPALSAILG